MVSVIFNNTDLSTLTNVLVHEVKNDNPPNRRLTNFTLAQADGKVHSSAFYDTKEILVSGVILATDENTYQQNRNTVLQYLSAEDANLDLNVGLSLLRYSATVESVIFGEVSGGYAAFDIKFVCSNPFGIDINTAHALTTTTVTSSGTTSSLTSSIGGSYDALPIITVYINSGSDMTPGKTITITNPANSKAIAITRDWAVGERLVIDNENQTVRVNNVDVEFTGTFINYAVGAGSITYTDDFSARNISLTVQYRKRYL